MPPMATSAPVQVSQTPASQNHPGAPTTGVRVAPRHEIAGRKGLGFAAAIYGGIFPGVNGLPFALAAGLII